MPKAELHVHLEGSIGPETLLRLASKHNRLASLPSTTLTELQDWFKFVDFPHFIRIYMVISELLRTPEDFALIVEACGADMAAQGIRYRELTFTPFTHTDLQRKALSIDNLLAGLDAGRAAAKAQYGVEMRWIFDIPRNASFARSGAYDPYPAQKTLEYALAGQAHGVIALGLGGNEVGALPGPFAPVFQAAKAAGLLSVPHAGETLGANSVHDAIVHLHADRIGHGVRAIEDPAVLTLLRDLQIPLEINVMSNISLHVFRRLAEHPFPHLDRMGLKVTLNSDDPPLFNTTLCDEYRAVAREFGYARRDLARIARNAFEVCGAPKELQQRWLAEFDAWQAGQLDLS